MTKKGKIFERLNEAFPLKPIRDDRHLEAALDAITKVNAFTKQNPSTASEAQEYLQSIERLIQEYKEEQPVH